MLSEFRSLLLRIILGLSVVWLFGLDGVIAKPKDYPPNNDLWSQGKYQEDYSNLKLHADAIGDVTYDLRLGRSALAVKKYDEAVMACDRVLINAPDRVDARWCLASAYYHLSLYDQAKSELAPLVEKKRSALFDQDISELSKKINREIAWRDRPYRIYGQVVFGYDNNVSAGTDEDYTQFLSLMGLNYVPDPSSFFYAAQVAALNSLNAKLREFNKKYKSTYLYPRIGIEGKHRFLNNKGNIFWDVNLAQKEYLEVDNFDITQSNAALGANYLLSPLYLLNGTFYYQEYLVDGKRYREAPLAGVSISRFIGDHNVIKIYTDDGVLMYPGNRPLTTYMYSGGLEWMYFNKRNVVITQIFYGRNQPRGGGAQYNGNNFYGAEVSARHRLTTKIDLTAGAAYQNALYDEKEFTGDERRRDSFYQLTAGFYYRFYKNLTWYVNTAYTNNHSKIFTYKYDRFEALTGVSFEF